MNDDPNKESLINNYDKYLDATRAFQYKFYDGVQVDSNRISTTIYSSFLSISTLGIIFITKNEEPNVLPLVLFIIIILMNIIWAVICKYRLQNKKYAYLVMIRDLEAPMSIRLNKCTLNTSQITSTFENLSKSLTDKIKVENTKSKNNNRIDLIVTILSILSLVWGWLQLLYPELIKVSWLTQLSLA